MYVFQSCPQHQAHASAYPSSSPGLGPFCTRMADLSRLAQWIIDALPSLQHGLRHLLPHSSLCFEGKGVVVPFAIPETRTLP
jgi:hypothetical protein